VSLPPAITTTDQCVVTKTGERITPSPCPVVPVAAVGSEVLTEPEPSRTSSDRKRSGRSIPRPQPNLQEAGSNPPTVIVREGERPREPKLCREVRVREDARTPGAAQPPCNRVITSSSFSAILAFTSLSTINSQPLWRFVFRRPSSTRARPPEQAAKQPRPAPPQ
jgi:hypothetical protein